MLGAAALVLVVVHGTTLLADPLGVSPIRLLPAETIVGTQRRFIVPQIARNPKFDGFVVGTSTVNALDPLDFEQALGGHFANLSIHGATPYEMSRVLEVVLRRPVPARIVVLGLDALWCAPTPQARYHAEVTLPDGLYAAGTLAQLREALTWRSFRFALEKIGLTLGLGGRRLPPNGYHDDLPPDSAWTEDRAATLAATRRGESGLQQPDVFPELGRLERLLAEAPPGLRIVAVLMPVFDPPDGLDLCKARVARLVGAAGGAAVDFMRPSPWTTDPTRYWDRLHFRSSVARSLPVEIGRALAAGRGAEAELWRVL